MTELIYYRYNNKEISTPTKDGFLTDFYRTNDWIKWIKKELKISEENFEKEKFNIQFKNETTQKEWLKLFYTNEEAKKTEWGKSDNKEFEGIISWPPIWIHPIMEDWMNSHCSGCGEKYHFDNRQLHKFFQKEKQKCYDWEKGDNVYIVDCKKCGFVGGIFKSCSYRICEDHLGKKRHFWIDAWKKLGVNPYPDRFPKEKPEIERLIELEEKSRSHK